MEFWTVLFNKKKSKNRIIPLLMGNGCSKGTVHSNGAVAVRESAVEGAVEGAVVTMLLSEFVLEELDVQDIAKRYVQWEFIAAGMIKFVQNSFK